MTKPDYQAIQRPKLIGFFTRMWMSESSKYGLKMSKAVARFERFVNAAYDAPDTAVSIAREDIADLDINSRAMLEQIGKLIRANNPSRACKLYAVALTQMTTKNGQFFRNVGRGTIAFIVLCVLGVFSFFALGLTYAIFAVS